MIIDWFRSELEERRVQAEKRAEKVRWSAPGKARVSHPDYGSVIVPCGSCFAAVLCASEVWGIDWISIIREAKVELCDQSLPAEVQPIKPEMKAMWIIFHPAYGYAFTEAEDETEAVRQAAKQWGTCNQLAELVQKCTIRSRRKN